MKNRTRKRILELAKLLSSSILPIIFWVCIIFGFDAPYAAVLTLIAAVIHELGHYLAILITTGEGSVPRGHATGFRIKMSCAFSYVNEIIILLAGPLANIAVFFGSAMFFKAGGYVLAFGYVNLATGLTNLLPLEGYDGYGALRELIESRNLTRLSKALETFSFIVGVALTFISLYLIDRFSEGYWIFGLFFFATLTKITNFAKYDIFEE